MPRRVRRRYLALRVVSEQELNQSDIMNAFRASLLQLFGEYGCSQVDLSLIEYNPKKGQAIVRCSHKSLETVRASIASITEIYGKPVVIHVMRVSGTLKTLRRKAVS